MSKVDVIMPQMGESIAEGTLTKWLRKPGETVERDEDLFEISTDKVDADIPAPASGVLAEILVQEGETVEVNTVVARIDTEASAVTSPSAPEPEGAETVDRAPEAVPAGAGSEAAATGVAEAVPGGIGTEPSPAGAGDATAGAEAEAVAAAEVPAAASSGSAESVSPGERTGMASREERLQTRSTPLVRKIAAEHGIDIAQLQGTGIAGRVTRDDILAYLEKGQAVEARPEAAGPASEAVAEPAEPGVLRVPIHGATLDIRIPRLPVREHDRVEEMNRVRLRTMEHMLMSQRISAHVTSVTEIDFERVVRLRRDMKPRFAEQGVKLTYGPFIMKAVIEGLLEYPILNASVDGTRIVYHGDINLGIAVSVNDGKELIVPVLKNADKLSLMGLAEGANALAEKARSRTLDFDDIQGGTFTITNVGVFGNLFGTPIINQPQVAILGTGVIEKRPVVVRDEMGNDATGIRHMSYFGLSYDHRVVDGAMAAFFLNKVQEVLETFPEDSV
ncbi:MAG: dihydrolipoamide acetyltransferase family protein [Gemmatimonadota bacterium]